jgi:hypothetical protein
VSFIRPIAASVNPTFHLHKGACPYCGKIRKVDKAHIDGCAADAEAMRLKLPPTRRRSKSVDLQELRENDEGDPNPA